MTRTQIAHTETPGLGTSPDGLPSKNHVRQIAVNTTRKAQMTNNKASEDWRLLAAEGTEEVIVVILEVDLKGQDWIS